MPQLLQPLAITRLTWLTSQRALLDLQAIQRLPGLAGYWPADPQYAYQDSAGYTTATVGGVVGQVRDISSAATPVARRNLLRYTEQFDNAAWLKIGQGTGAQPVVTANYAADPDGNLLADRVQFDQGGGVKSITDRSIIYQDVTDPSSGYGTASVWIKSTDGTSEYTLGLVVGVTPNTPINVNGSWQRFTLTSSPYNPTVVNLSIGVFGDVGRSTTPDVLITKAQVEHGAEATPYQKIVTGTGDVFAPGNHAYQQTTSKKPILKRTPTSNVYWLNSDDGDELTATLGNLGTACTVARSGAEGVTFTEGVTISSTYNIAPAYGFNGDVAIFNRALTASEKALVTRYMSRGIPMLDNNILSSTWTQSGGWTVTDGIVTAEGSIGADYCQNTLLTPTAAGATYLANLTACTLSSFYLDFGSGTGTQIGNITTFPTKVVMSGGPAPGTIFRIGRWSGAVYGTAGPFVLRKII
ncbi:MAG: hypothetical protein KBE53_00925 [Chromatiaceae bacterium]|nr:hypothetical protein [Chromatiaceae bacterium]